MTVKEMDKFTVKRWSALIDAVNIVYDKSEKCGVAEKDIVLKQNHLVRYVDETTERIRVV
jgi:hypothetical protein